MNLYTRPGLNINEQMIIDLIRDVFDLKNEDWITSKSRKLEFLIPRQIFMTCVIDFLGYSQQKTVFRCNRNEHSTAINAQKRVKETLMPDKVYGKRTRLIFDTLKRLYDQTGI